MKYRNYTTTELIVMDAGRDYYDPELVAEICDRAGLEEELEASDGESFEGVLNRAVKILLDREGIRTFSFWAGL
jgi:hypothetical protein